MRNKEIAKIFSEMSVFLAMDEIPFKPQAYERASQEIENLTEEIEDIYKKQGRDGLKKIPGIGEGMAEKIIEYLKTGKIKEHQDFKKNYPVEIEELNAVEGVGPKIIKELYRRLKIRNLKELERAAKEGKLRELPGFGKIKERNILQGIEFLKKSSGRHILPEILTIIEGMEKELKGFQGVEKLSVCGSIRRKKETIGDVDFLAAAKNPEKLMDFFCSQKRILKVLSRGKTRSSIKLEQGFDVDLRVVPLRSYGAALQYFTGSKEHNIHLRRIAEKKGLKINEYGIFKNQKMIGGENEEEIYKTLEMEMPLPEIREDRGEIEVALKNKLPRPLEIKDIKGDLHCHSNWDGGKNSILEMAQKAKEMGYEYLGITDHTKFLTIENGLNEKQLLRQHQEIEKTNSKFKIQNSKFRILHGCEANIMLDGSLDIKDEVLKKLDYAVAGIHSSFKMSSKEMTARILRAMRNPYVKIISHPTGRLLQKRDEYQIDFEEILRVAEQTGTVLEINSSPLRLDLNDLNIKKAKEAGVGLAINSDAHERNQMENIKYGVFQARRGWAEREDVINAYSLEKLLEFLGK